MGRRSRNTTCMVHGRWDRPLMMPYMGLNIPETPIQRYCEEQFIHPGTILVTGPQSSGNRLMCRILEAGGFVAYLDTRHGREYRRVDRVVVMYRERRATLDSIAQNFVPADRIDPDLSLRNIAVFYPDAHWVDYDSLCADPDSTIASLASWLNVEPWQMPEPITVSVNTRRY